MQNGWTVVQVSALGRRSDGTLSSDKRMAEARAARLNSQSTGEIYEVKWHIGMPRDAGSR